MKKESSIRALAAGVAVISALATGPVAGCGYENSPETNEPPTATTSASANNENPELVIIDAITAQEELQQQQKELEETRIAAKNSLVEEWNKIAPVNEEKIPMYSVEDQMKIVIILDTYYDRINDATTSEEIETLCNEFNSEINKLKETLTTFETKRTQARENVNATDKTPLERIELEIVTVPATKEAADQAGLDLREDVAAVIYYINLKNALVADINNDGTCIRVKVGYKVEEHYMRIFYIEPDTDTNVFATFALIDGCSIEIIGMGPENSEENVKCTVCEYAPPLVLGDPDVKELEPKAKAKVLK